MTKWTEDPFYESRKNRFIEILKRRNSLIENKGASGKTALHAVSQLGNLDAVKFLLDNG